jgi:hypothetical protein
MKAKSPALKFRLHYDFTTNGTIIGIWIFVPFLAHHQVAEMSAGFPRKRAAFFSKSADTATKFTFRTGLLRIVEFAVRDCERQRSDSV